MRVPFFFLVASSLTTNHQAAPSKSPLDALQDEQKTVFDFTAGDEPWPSIDDVVMGGRSQSTMSLEGDALEGGVAVFKGSLSLENNGGFASLRSLPAAHDLTGFDGIVLRVRGDGKTYGVRLRTQSSFDGVSYQAQLTTEAGSWNEMRIPFRDFAPTYRGRRVRNHPPLVPSEIKTFGLIIADRQAGPFRLEIESIKAYSVVGSRP